MNEMGSLSTEPYGYYDIKDTWVDRKRKWGHETL